MNDVSCRSERPKRARPALSEVEGNLVVGKRVPVCEFMNELVKVLPETVVRREAGLADAVGEIAEAESAGGVALRALRQLLDEKNPEHDWGGLRKTLTPEGHYLWLCEYHAQEYLL
ncbi:MAG: hypothetical protein JSV36_21835 [Anaerolineae bacterium]|nr:MAG: hypothetical protein JSV36_21835 [Anaerolineae bacterium]